MALFQFVWCRILSFVSAGHYSPRGVSEKREKPVFSVARKSPTHQPRGKPPSFIIFYRWYTNDRNRERGRVMARLVAEVLKSLGAIVWLDQIHMDPSSEREEVLIGISEAFRASDAVIMLAAPGDWDRFADADDIHRLEWEMSLQSGKPIHLLQFEVDCGKKVISPWLSQKLGPLGQQLSDFIAKHGEVAIDTYNIDQVLRRIWRGEHVICKTN